MKHDCLVEAAKRFREAGLPTIAGILEGNCECQKKGKTVNCGIAALEGS